MDSSYDLDLSKITAEFEGLRGFGNNDSSKIFKSALLPQNTRKNRYPNILPIEHTRVRLNPHCDFDEDYINANYIDGEVGGSSRYYIAAQAPLQNTVNDFWRMIWEERCPVIVCLTRLQEQGREKTAHYWPEGEEILQFGKIHVLCNTTMTYKNIIVRSLILWRAEEPNETRETIHLHHQEWPDFGTPTNSVSVRALASLVTSLKERGACMNCPGPAVVHCSAGIGRAGTFITIHMILRKLERLMSAGLPASIHTLPISIKETVSRLREQRFGCVCTKDQYLFIYQTVLDALESEESKRQSSPKPHLRHSYGYLTTNTHGQPPSLPPTSTTPLSVPTKDFLDILIERDCGPDSKCYFTECSDLLNNSPRSRNQLV